MKDSRLVDWWRRRAARRQQASLEGRLEAELRRSVRGVVRVLGESGLARGLRSENGGTIPWYLVLGESQAGKSAALGASGFESVASGGAAEDGVPTVVQAWCSGDALAWELSSRALEAGPEDAGFRALIGELSRRRPRRPLDGVVVILPVDPLLASGFDLAGLAARTRTLLEALERQLGLRLPVYLWVTKLDRVPDLAPFWSGLSPELCQRPWGASWSLREPAECSFGPRVAAELAVLGQVVHAHALHLWCLAGECVPAAFGFPAHFAELAGRLASYVQSLTEVRPCRPSVGLRGFYLCSAHPPCLDDQNRGWFFRDLFRLAILADRDSSRRSSRALERHRREQALLLAAIAFGSLAVAVPVSLSQRENLQLIAMTEASLRPPPPLQSAARRAEVGNQLDPLLAQLEPLEAAAQRVQIPGFWGPHRAPGLRDIVARAYRQHLAEVVSGPVQEQLLAALRAVGDVARFDWAGFWQAERTLKLYLMLSHPEHLDPEWALPELLQVWERARQRGACAGQGPLEPHVRRWLTGLADGSNAAWIEQEDRVRRVRSGLLSLPFPELALTWLAQQAEEVPPVRAAHILNAAAAKTWNVGGDSGVPGLYTRAGWEKIRSAFEAASLPSSDAWVFGHAVPTGWGRERLQQVYFERYARAWRDFSRALGAPAALGVGASNAPWGNEASVERLELLADVDGPLARWFQQLEANARLQLAEPAQTPSDRAVAMLGSRLSAPQDTPLSPLERDLSELLRFGFGDERASRFANGSALSEYQKQLQGLVAALREPNELPGAGTDVLARVTRVAQSVERLLSPLPPADRDALQGLLLAPIEGGLAAARLRETSRLSERWRTDVAEPVQRLSDRYPFEPQAAEDATLADLQAVFAPRTGSVWKFVETELRTRVVEAGGRFENRGARADEPLAPGVLACLGAARELRDAWFGSEAALAVAFVVQLSSSGQGASAVSLSVDGATIVAERAMEKPDSSFPSATSLRWPGAAASAGAVVQLRQGNLVDELRRAGPFGWLRLLAAGGLRPSAQEPGAWEASWDLNHGQTRVTAELRAQGSARAFSPALFEHLRCPMGLFATRRGDRA